MLEVVSFVLLVVLIILIWVYYLLSRESAVVAQLGEQIELTRSKLRLAERKFLQRKISKNVFDSLISGFESDLVSLELERAALSRPVSKSAARKAEEILERLPNPPKRLRVKVASLLKETEALRHEMAVLESKLLKHEIREAVFEKLMTVKESELIRAESELLRVVEEFHKGKILEGISGGGTQTEKK